MGGISTGIGLISGIDTFSLIEQLIAIESRPKIMAINRMIQLQSEQSAFLGLNSLLLSLKDASRAFDIQKIFQSAQAASSDAKVLTATASTKAQPGTFQFLVHRLVASSQRISKGFADSDTIQLGATQISFEFGNGRIETDTRLGDLNGGDGVARGKISITDSSGANAVVDLSTAVTLNDVLDAINSTTEVSVTATVAADGSGLVVTDGAGGPPTTFQITDVPGFTTATDLGIAKTGSDNGQGVGEITGDRINSISGNTVLTSLNDGNGVLISGGLDVADFKITTRSNATTFDIVLGQRTAGSDIEPAAATLQDVIDRINEITGGDVTATIGDDGVSIKLTDNTTDLGGTFEVIAGTLSDQAARDLGIFKTAGANPAEIDGDRILAGMNTILVKSLNGGAGLNGNTALTIQDRAGGADSLTLDETASLSDIVDQINSSASVDVTASLNAAGNGLLITDNTGGAGNLIIDGSAATELGISTGPTGVAADTVQGTNLQLQYVSGASKLEDLNYGRGVGTGSFRITDGYGNQETVDIGSDAVTLQDIIDEINSKSNILVTASVNANGDGLLLTADEDASSNPFVTALKVESLEGTTARDLAILGESASLDPADNLIDGSYEKTISLDATDTLDDIVQKINDANINAKATLINDGNSSTPFHLTFTSTISGLGGDLIIDIQGADLSLTTLTEAQDAVVFFGSDDPAKGILITSSTNTLDKVIPGVNIDLKSTSDTVVELNISRDLDTMTKAAQSFVDGFNAVISRIRGLDSFDSETESRGALLGNPTVARIQAQLTRIIQGKAVGIDTQFTHLTQIGIRIGEEGKLTFDEDRFREALDEDLEAVENLLAARVVSDDQTKTLGQGITTPANSLLFDSQGVAELIGELARGLTDSIDGVLTVVNRTYDSRISLQQKRIENFDRQLDNRRKILTRQFTRMEQALAALQAQQSALNQLSFLG